MPLLPTPYPDEVLGSIVIRAVRNTGLPLKRLLKGLWQGRERTDIGFVLSTGADRLGMLCGLSGDELLEHHTLLPYIVAFKPSDEQRRLRAKCLPIGSRESSVAAMVQSVTAGTARLRYCPVCVREDLDRYGESYWHRAHLMPAVVVCCIHRVRLLQTSMSLGSRLSWNLRQPHEVPARPCPGRLTRPVLDTIARLSVEALSGALPVTDSWHAEHRISAMAKGYVKRPDIVAASTPFALALREFFGSRLLADAGCAFPTNARNPWPSLMLRSEQPWLCFITVKHVLVRTFLELGPPAPPEFGYQQVGKKPADHRKDDERAVRAMQRILKAAKGTDQRFSVKGLLTDLGIWSAYRHNRHRFPKTRALIAAFRESDQAERQLGRRARWRHLNERAANSRGQESRPERDEVGP